MNLLKATIANSIIGMLEIANTLAAVKNSFATGEWNDICSDFGSKVKVSSWGLENLVAFYAIDNKQTQLLRYYVNLDLVRGTVVVVDGAEYLLPKNGISPDAGPLELGVVTMAKLLRRIDVEKPE